MTNSAQWNPTQRRKSIPRARIERWLGKEKAEHLSSVMRGWYGPPINLRDIPGSVWIDGNGEYVGKFERGEFFSAEDAFETFLRKLKGARQRFDLANEMLPLYAGAGFASISDALSRASQGFSQTLHGGLVSKASVGNVAGASYDLWMKGTSPAAGALGAAAPGGTAPVKSATGAMVYNNPATGTLHLTGSDFNSTTINNSLMVYDRLFAVTKNMNSTAAEAVTGVPTRYQSSTVDAADYAGGSFAAPVVGQTLLAATAHNWASCTYRNQAGTDAHTFPTQAGISAAGIDRLDLPLNLWFMPLNGNDVGVMDLANMQLSAAVATGTLNWVIMHPIGIMAFPIITAFLPFDWLTSRDLTPRIFDDACLSLLELPKPNTSATTYGGRLIATNAAA